MSYDDMTCWKCGREATRFPGPACPHCDLPHRAYMSSSTPNADAAKRRARKPLKNAPWQRAQKPSRPAI